MSYINHREAHVSAEVDRIFDFIHSGEAAQRAADEVLPRGTRGITS